MELDEAEAEEGADEAFGSVRREEEELRAVCTFWRGERSEVDELDGLGGLVYEIIVNISKISNKAIEQGQTIMTSETREGGRQSSRTKVDQ